MEQFIIEGPARLNGELQIYGSKNHALKLIPACFLSKGETVITNVPEIEDVFRLLEIVEEIGGTVKNKGTRTIAITPPKSFNGSLPRDLVPTLRASIVLVGPLLARYGVVELPHPGGDNIGKRPINFFIEGLTALGATVEHHDQLYRFTAKKGLVGAPVCFPSISVTGTETVMMAAVLASGMTVIYNAACEPEIVALAEYLNSVGAHIEGAGTHTITIHGKGNNTDALVSSGTVEVIPDRIETGSFLALAAGTQSHITITHCNPKHITIPLCILQSMGVKMSIGETTIEVESEKKLLQSRNIVTHEYPGFPTDLQAPMTVLLTQAEGNSLVHETLYDGRLVYTDILKSFGVSVDLLDPHRALIKGPSSLRGTTVESPDLRAGLAFVIAGLIATGTTTIQNIYHIDRGYERIEERLQSVGAHITRAAVS